MPNRNRTDLALTAEQFGAAFPFHLVWDADGRILQVGRVLSRICAGLDIGRPVGDVLDILRPKGTPFDLERLTALQRSLFILRMREHPLTLRGQVTVDTAANRACFLGSPWITRFDEASALGLSLGDFANHDPIGEFLILFQTKDASLRESEALADALAHERAALSQVNAALERQMIERGEAEQALRRSEALYRSMFDTVGDVMFHVDPRDGTWTLLNPAWTTITGFTREESIGRPALEFVDPAFTAIATGWLAELSTGTTSDLHRRVRMRTKAGPSRDLDVSAHVVLGRDGAVAAIVGAASDVTAQVERERTLQQANAELSRAMRLKDEFLSGMSHELRTPLNAVIGLCESLLEGVYGGVAPAQQRTLSHIEASGRHLLALINEILDLSKIEAGKLVLDLGPVAVGTACRAALAMLEPTVRKKSLHVTLDVEPGVGTIHADERRVRQVALNLLGNAVKFTPDGGAVRVRVTRDPATGAVRLDVEDTGVGIAPEDIKRLFLPFSQLDAGLSRRFGGTGLGLVISRRIVELHGGTVHVESVPGEGSRFSVSWPGGVTAPAAERAAVPAPVTTVVVADGSENTRLVVASYLGARGLAVKSAATLDEAVTLTADGKPRVVVIDMQLSAGGAGAIASLRAAAGWVVPVIALVSADDEGLRRECLDAGAHALPRPVSLPALLDLVGVLQAGHEEAVVHG